MSASVSEVLNKAAEVVERPGAWITGDAARDANGNPVSSCEEIAVCWCAVGAINRAAYELGVSRFSAYPPLESVVGGVIPYWNDAPGRTQAEVVAALRAAASQAEGAA